MAKALRSKVEEHLICSVCLEQLKDPKVLPCLHSFCQECIVKLAKNAKSDCINCPECHMVVKVGTGSISSLASNFFVNNLSTLALTNDDQAKEIICDICDSGDAAKTRCNDCGNFLCSFCTEFHKRSRSTKFHKLFSMSELKSGASAQSVAEKVKCAKHKDEIVKLYCQTCKMTICRDCTIVDHRQHDYRFVDDVAAQEKESLQKNLNAVKERKGRLVQGISNLKKFHEGLEAKKRNVILEVNRHFDELARLVELQRKEMILKATSLTSSKQKQIRAQLGELEFSLASCDSSIKFTEKAFKNGNDVQILSMARYILQSLTSLNNVHDQTEPCVSEDLFFVMCPVKAFKENWFSVYRVRGVVASPPSCTASINSPKEQLELNEQSSITVTCYDKCSTRVPYGGHLIKPSFTGVEVSDVTVTDNNDGSQCVCFIPQSGGLLKFEVTIEGDPAPRCSLTKGVNWVLVTGRKGAVNSRVLHTGQYSSRGQYSCRVGGCYFDSGVHIWKVKIGNNANYHGPYYTNHTKQCEIGVADCSEMNSITASFQRKWVFEVFNDTGMQGEKIVSFTLDMKSKILSSEYGQHRVTAQRVLPVFICYSPIDIEIVECSSVL